MMDNSANVPAYIARCKCGCGGIVFAAVDDPSGSETIRQDNAKEIAKLIRKGYAVERSTVGVIRTSPFTCQRGKAA